MLRRIFIVLLTVMIGMTTAHYLTAQVPGMISYQARIIDEETGPVSDTRTISFAIYSQAESGIPIWSEEQNVIIVNGIANVFLGSVVPLTPAIFQSDERYLGVKIGADPELRPRERLLSVPYALRAESATIRISPSGGISSTDVTAAIKELDAEKLSLTGGTLNGRLNVYNEGTNDVGIDALSADSAAIIAMNSGSDAPSLMTYNYGDGHGLFSFAEIGAALFAANESSGYASIVTTNSAEDGMAIYAYTENSGVTCSVSNNGDGFALWATAKEGITIGADGEGDLGTIVATNQGNGSGIYGYSKSGYGIRAVSDGEYSALSAENTGGGTGLWGVSNTGVGVSGLSMGSERGVYGYSKSGTGVYGYSEGSGFDAYGVYGYSKNGEGVWGASTNDNGVVAMTLSDDYAALYAQNNGNGKGIYTIANDANGLYVKNNSSTGYSTIYALSEGEATAIFAYSKNGNAGGFETEHSSKYALFARSANKSSSNPGLKVYGYATITGGVRSTMLTSAGLARAHSIYSPQAEFSFSGSARLSGGEAEVTFASTWKDCISEAADYRVLITPTEMCNGICCIEKTSTGFKVKELMNGSSNASFDWMVRAVRKGSSTEEILLAGAGQSDLGMEIIEPEEEIVMQAKIEQEKEKRQEPIPQAPTLSAVPGQMSQLKQRPPIKRTSPDMEQKIQQVREYKERLKQRAQAKGTR